MIEMKYGIKNIFTKINKKKVGIIISIFPVWFAYHTAVVSTMEFNRNEIISPLNYYYEGQTFDNSKNDLKLYSGKEKINIVTGTISEIALISFKDGKVLKIITGDDFPPGENSSNEYFLQIEDKGKSIEFSDIERLEKNEIYDKYFVYIKSGAGDKYLDMVLLERQNGEIVDIVMHDIDKIRIYSKGEYQDFMNIIEDYNELYELLQI